MESDNTRFTWKLSYGIVGVIALLLLIGWANEWRTDKMLANERASSFSGILLSKKDIGKNNIFLEIRTRNSNSQFTLFSGKKYWLLINDGDSLYKHPNSFYFDVYKVKNGIRYLDCRIGYE